MYNNNNNETKYIYKGIEIHCPQCGRTHGLGVEQNFLNADEDLYEVWMQCPTCGLKFDGVSVGKWRRSEKFKELNKVFKDLSNAFAKQTSTIEDKTIWTVYFLDDNQHNVTKCFRTKCGEHGISYILEQLNRTCRDGERYLAWETLD